MNDDFVPGQYSNDTENSQKEIQNSFMHILASEDAPQEIAPLSELEAGFMTRLAQTTELAPEEEMEFGDQLAAADDNPVDQEDAELPDLDTDSDEMDAIQDLISWDSFSIIFDPHYAKLLEDDNMLPPAKAKAKSHYIYFNPENKRLEGVINKRYIGGYGTKEDLGDDFSHLKSLSPEGFAPDWKETLLIDIDELPAVENSKVKEQLREKAKEEDKAEKNRVNEFEAETGGEKLNEPDNTVNFPTPEPVGQVDTSQLPAAASIKDISMRRMSRLKELKNI